MLRQRVLTAVVLGAVIIGIICTGSSSLFSILMSLFVFLSAWEWAELSGNPDKLSRIIYAVLVTGVMSLLYFAVQIPWTNAVYILGTIWWFIAAIMVIGYQAGMQIVPENRIIKYLVGCFVLVPAALSLVYIYASDNGLQQVLLLFILVWIVDITAFFVGRRLGRRRLASLVSPGKSWEGFIGSLIAAAIMALIYGGLGHMSGADIIWITLLFIITAGFSVVGDLFESMFKRNSHMKDSGRLLPGHGGVLDRIDSLTAAAPVYALGLWLLGAK